jgi:integral membrane sensor domain MASE1
MKRSAGFAARIGSPFDRPAAFIVELCVIGAAYYGLAKGGLALASLHPSATPIWPPTGFALAAVLLRGYRVWPAIFLAALIANATTAGSLATSVAIGAGNALEGVVGAFLVNRWSNGRDTFATPAGIARFSLLSFVPTAMCATIGVGSLAAAGFADGANVGSIWLTWWLGDLAGALVITPVLVLWVMGSSPWSRRDLAERAAVLAGACAVGLIAFSPLVEQTAHTAPLGFLAVVPLLWSALRLAPRDTATVALVLSGFAVWGTLAGGGPFARANLNDSFLLLLMFMIATTVPSLVLSAEVAVRKRTDEDLREAQAEAALLESQERLAQAQKMEALGQLTGGIAHDFNNILMIVSGHAEMLRRRVAEPKALRGLDAIERAIRRGENLTRQLLTFGLACRRATSAACPDERRVRWPAIVSSSRSATPAPASRRTCFRGSSIRSSPPRRWARAPGLGCRRCTASCANRAVRSPPRASWDAAPPSPCGSRAAALPNRRSRRRGKPPAWHPPAARSWWSRTIPRSRT